MQLDRFNGSAIVVGEEDVIPSLMVVAGLSAVDVVTSPRVLELGGLAAAHRNTIILIN